MVRLNNKSRKINKKINKSRNRKHYKKGGDRDPRAAEEISGNNSNSENSYNENKARENCGEALKIIKKLIVEENNMENINIIYKHCIDHDFLAIPSKQYKQKKGISKWKFIPKNDIKKYRDFIKDIEKLANSKKQDDKEILTFITDWFQSLIPDKGIQDNNSIQDNNDIQDNYIQDKVENMCKVFYERWNNDLSVQSWSETIENLDGLGLVEPRSPPQNNRSFGKPFRVLNTKCNTMKKHSRGKRNNCRTTRKQ